MLPAAVRECRRAPRPSARSERPRRAPLHWPATGRARARSITGYPARIPRGVPATDGPTRRTGCRPLALAGLRPRSSAPSARQACGAKAIGRSAASSSRRSRRRVPVPQPAPRLCDIAAARDRSRGASPPRGTRCRPCAGAPRARGPRAPARAREPRAPSRCPQAVARPAGSSLSQRPISSSS